MRILPTMWQADMDLTHLAEKARALPKSPGVYLMKDDKGEGENAGGSAATPSVG